MSLLIFFVFGLGLYDNSYAEDFSIYELKAKLVDKDNKEIGFDTYKGSPVLISMFYGSCPHICPALIRNIRSIEKQLGKKAKKRVKVLLISFDPERDTPKALKALAKKHYVDDKSNWNFASGESDAVREIAAVMGIKYRKLDNGEFNHTSKIVVLDSKGRNKFEIDGVKSASKDDIKELESLLANPKF